MIMETLKIHYCWFGNNPKSKVIQKCIKSWRKYFPDAEIIEWNESNFDVNCNIYVQQAYAAKKYAFVSDYARFWALEKFGGLYFDTDVEVIRSLEPLLKDEAFAGFETPEFIAPGLVLYAKEPKHSIIQEAKAWYERSTFLDENGERIKINVCGMFTDILKGHGFTPNNQLQICDGMTLYPIEYFCPYNDATGVLKKTENTYCIHWYAKSWMSPWRVFRNKVTRVIHRIFGVNIKQKLKGLFKKKK